MNFTPYSPTVTWYMCAKYAAFNIFGTKGVNVWVCGQVVVTQPSRQEKTYTVYVSMNTGYVAFQRKK